MSVTSLTGTTWVINVNPVYSPFTKQVISSLKQTNIRASIIAGGATYDYISVLVNSNKLSISYGVNGGNSTTAYTQDNGWTSDSLRTVAFSSDATVSGNYDATTEETIEWLEANAVQVVPDVSVSLGTSSIASLNDTGSVTLATQNTYLTDDITVEYTKPSAPTPTLQSKSVTYSPSITQQTDTVTADSGYDGLSSVNVTVDAVSRGTAGTPTATKGTVSNNSVSVTPSVTNVGGMIPGGTKTGTAVTVSASELVSGTLSITSNGTYNVANFSSAFVNVSGGGEDTVVPFIENHGTMTSFAHSSITKIGQGAFAYCSSLTTASFPSCTSIESYAFYSCNKLKTTSFPLCETIGGSAFYNCSSLTTASFPSCTSIWSYAFYSCKNFTTASFPLCKTISGSAFYSCTSLTTASFQSCTSIGMYAFYNCNKLTTVSFPLCKTISGSAFYNCSSLTTASFPSCTSIGSYAFYGCTRLSSISFPSCTTISAYAFEYCGSLTAVSFPYCTTISTYAFGYCYNLTVVSLPSCTTIYNSTFYRCYKLISLYLLGSSITTLSNSNAFLSTPIAGYTTSTGGVYGSIYVPSSLYSSYKTATNWTYFSSRFVSV